MSFDSFIYKFLTKERKLFMTTSKPLSIGEIILKSGRKCVRKHKKQKANDISWFNQQLIHQAKYDYSQHSQECEYWKNQPREFFVGTCPVEEKFFYSIGFNIDQDDSHYGYVTLTPCYDSSSPFVQTYNACLKSIKKHYLHRTYVKKCKNYWTENISWLNQQLIHQAVYDYSQYDDRCEYWKDQPKVINVDTVPVKEAFFNTIGFAIEHDILRSNCIILTPCDKNSAPFVQVYNASLRSITKQRKKAIYFCNFFQKEILKKIQNRDYKVQYTEFRGHDCCEISIDFSYAFSFPYKSKSFITNKISQMLYDEIPELIYPCFISEQNGFRLKLLVQID